MDCSVACLSMLLGLSYEAVLVAFKHNVLVQGATIRQVLKAAERLGHPLKWSRKVNLETDTGILGITSPRLKTDHLVVLKNELIIDTDAYIYEADDYFVAIEGRATSIIKQGE